MAACFRQSYKVALDNFAGLKCHIKVRRWPWARALDSNKLSGAGVRELYERHGPALLAYARSFVGDAGIAEDVVQQVFVKLLQGEAAVPDIPAAYLYRAVRNGALNARRNGLRNAPLEQASLWFVHRGGNQEAALSLQAALGELPEEQREVVMMRIWSGMTLDEIAAATHVSLNTVASRYRYALEKLRQQLKPYQKV
jgi:RNA polymerase sigma-70 factor (ECF subfamily)